MRIPGSRMQQYWKNLDALERILKIVLREHFEIILLE